MAKANKQTPKIDKDQDWTNPGADEFLFIPLGGCSEIGMNLNLYGHNGSWIIVDCGVTFPGTDLPGVDVVTPNIEFVLALGDRLEAVILTHAHEDHIGAVPYLAEWLKCPVYATGFTAALLRRKLHDDDVRLNDLRQVPQGSTVECGPFTVEYIGITHSIPEPNALCISTPIGSIFHTGDWKLDDTPTFGEVYDEARFRELGESGMLAMVCDSTNALIPGRSGSEQEAAAGLVELIAKQEGRIAVACFASNVARLASIVRAATAAGRRVGLIGRSMLRVVDSAVEAGYLRDWPKLEDPASLMRAPPNEVLLLCTGSQGEPRAALRRIADNSHPFVRLNEGDSVIFSSRVIPGNEKSVYALQNRLLRSGLHVLTAERFDIHVSGHPCRDELKDLYGWVKPQCSIPVHGEARQQFAHAELAEEIGVPHHVIPDNGDVVRFLPGPVERVGRVHSGRWAVEGDRLLPIDSAIYNERRRLSDNGVLWATVVVDSENHAAAEPQMQSLGVVDSELEKDERFRLEKAFVGIVDSLLRGGGDSRRGRGGPQRGRGRRGESERDSGSGDPLERELIRRLRQACEEELGRSPRVYVRVVRV